MQILSTKKLKSNQRDLLLGAGFRLVEYNAIAIEQLDFKIPSKIENAIFSSQNGVKAFISQAKALLASQKGEEPGVRIAKIFCVGQKTKELLKENGLKVVKMAQNSAELGHFIAKDYKNESFHYFCGSKRRDELPKILKTSKIQFFEVKTYKTILKPHKFSQKWDGILFFSPSGVKSFIAQNTLENTPAFCIGATTAAEAKKHTATVVIANSTSVESVIAKTVKTLQ